MRKRETKERVSLSDMQARSEIVADRGYGLAAYYPCDERKEGGRRGVSRKGDVGAVRLMRLSRQRWAWACRDGDALSILHS